MAWDYDMIVIGGGAAGLTAAGMSALLRARTLLIEAHRLGGECTWTGCVPSKALLAAARVAHQARQAGNGVRASVEVDFPRVMDHVRDIQERIYQSADAPPNLEKFGVTIMRGTARFVDTHTVEIAGQGGGTSRVSSRFFVVATGSRPRELLLGVPTLTNESLFELTSLPERLAVIGAGPIGIEMAQAFGRLGSKVTVIESGSAILPNDDPEVTGELQRLLTAEGIRFLLGHKVVGASKDGSGTTLVLESGERVECDAVLVAVGRQANYAELALGKAGVDCKDDKIHIDKRCRTSTDHIYATGDVAAKFRFTHMAEHMSKVAVSNALLHTRRKVDNAHVVWCTFTDPELAHLGANEAELERRGRRYQVFRFPYSKLDRAIVDGSTDGLIKVLATRGGRILGVTILGAHAGELISEWALAMRNRLKVKQVANTIHPYPTYALANRRAADETYVRLLRSPLLGLVRTLFGYRGAKPTSYEL